MKSGKQRKSEIKKVRQERMRKLDDSVNPFEGPIPDWATPVNSAEIVYHSMYMDIPLFYVDREFTCKQCGMHEVWPAKRQKWWYEVAKGSFETTAILCRSCRDKKKVDRDIQRKNMEEMAKKEPHPNEAFFKNT